ncbi:hypothetical protein [Streptomyces sp900116325]|uniref:hypothetical protein n=1 Tax=Streptomyces sp. 900116325 TaxID=3154295 RepID=UPI0033F4813B
MAAAFVVIPDQRGLPVRGLQAFAGQGGDLQRAAAGVPQEDVDGLVEQLEVGGGDVAAALDLSGAEGVQVGVELADDRLGEGFADAVLVLLFQTDPVLDRVAGEGSRESVQVSGAAAVVDQLEEAGQERAPLGGAVGRTVTSQRCAEGVDDRAGIREAQCCRVEAFPGPLGQGPGGDGQGALQISEGGMRVGRCFVVT